MDLLHNVENCYSWHTATVHEPGFPLREELSFTLTPGHHADCTFCYIVLMIVDVLNRLKVISRCRKIRLNWIVVIYDL